MILRYRDYRAMYAHVQSQAPLEACGLVAGRHDFSQKVFPITNILHSASRYRMAPEEQVRALMTIHHAGMELLAIYHSHPAGPPWPSLADLHAATYPVPYLIWAPIGTTWVVRAFHLSDHAREIPVRLH